ncbi:MAG: NTP transferase domain-containing protein [Chloroflexota bacterium]
MTGEGAQPIRVAAIVLAAGRSSRFGRDKLAARLNGRPVLQHVLDALATTGIDDPVVVVGNGDGDSAVAIDWRAARRVRNAEPDLGLSHSLQLGWAAVMSESSPPDVIVVALGDQPTIDPATVRRLLAEPLDSCRPVLSARHRDGSRNPVRLEPAAADLVAQASGDHGLGPLMDGHPDRVRELTIPRMNPDVDVPAHLEALIAASWAERVRANAYQVERVRATPEEVDFYAPVTRMFVVDPARRDDPVLDALLPLTRPGDTWLDIGAGAGRYALPIAAATRQVIALDPSSSMLAALREGAVSASIGNVRVLEGRWPPDPDTRAELGDDPVADVALIAHVGYDIEAIVPFLDAMEAAARCQCVAVLMGESPASIATPFWPLVHGQDRIPLPALPEFLELLDARGVQPEVSMIPSERRRWPDRAELQGFLRRQLWTSPGSDADQRLEAAIAELTEPTVDGGLELVGSQARDVGIVTWSRPRV